MEKVHTHPSLLHYPEQIILLGPITKTWTMRHEAKLSFFKKASFLSNFKNISLSLANNHQRWICYEMASGKLVMNSIECGPAKLNNGLTCIKDKPDNVKHALKRLFPQLNEETDVFRPKWIRKLSTTYKENSFVIIQSDGLDPIFGHIDDIIVVAGDCIFCAHSF